MYLFFYKHAKKYSHHIKHYNSVGFFISEQSEQLHYREVSFRLGAWLLRALPPVGRAQFPLTLSLFHPFCYLKSTSGWN